MYTNKNLGKPVLQIILVQNLKKSILCWIKKQEGNEWKLKKAGPMQSHKDRESKDRICQCSTHIRDCIVWHVKISNYKFKKSKLYQLSLT